MRVPTPSPRPDAQVLRCLFRRKTTDGNFVRPGRGTLLALLSFALAGCGVIPGDAALQLGSPERAAKLYLSEANQGNAEAAVRLGTLIANREVSAANYGSAIDWFKKACESGNPEGCHNLGVAYEYGTHCLPKDYAEARAYYLKAAIAGYMPSQYNLAGLYANNHVSPANDLEGLKWVLLAQMSAGRHQTRTLSHWVTQDLAGYRSRLEMRLSDAQLREARILAEGWKAAGTKAKPTKLQPPA